MAIVDKVTYCSRICIPYYLHDTKYEKGKHSIVSEAFCMNQVTFALQNIKIRLWYFAYIFSRLIEGEKDYEKLLPSAVARR